MIDLSKSIDFLLENGGDVIKYRLHKEILKDMSEVEEAALLEKVMETPKYKLLESYVKPNGYIGIGMHSWDKFKETRLQDGEAAARLLSNYAIPKDAPIVANFVRALRNDEVLEEEFSYYHPEIGRFQNRFVGLNCGGGLMVLIYACQALLGYGDDEEVRPFVETSYCAFESLLHINSLEDITKVKVLKKGDIRYIEPDTYFPCQYHLETLAHTNSWRNDESVKTLVRAINFHDEIMTDAFMNAFSIKDGNHYNGPLWAYTYPFCAFESCKMTGVTAQRKTLTHLAMIGGDKIDVVRKTADFLEDALSRDGVLRPEFESAYQKRCFKASLEFPTPYGEIALEPSHKTDTALWCELTFWAVQLLSIVGRRKQISLKHS